MEERMLNLAKKLSKKYNKKEILLLEMINKCQLFGLNNEETEKVINEFEKIKYVDTKLNKKN